LSLAGEARRGVRERGKSSGLWPQARWRREVLGRAAVSVLRCLEDVAMLCVVGLRCDLPGRFSISRGLGVLEYWSIGSAGVLVVFFAAVSRRQIVTAQHKARAATALQKAKAPARAGWEKVNGRWCVGGWMVDGGWWLAVGGWMVLQVLVQVRTHDRDGSSGLRSSTSKQMRSE
jgi:hypothetical protein